MPYSYCRSCDYEIDYPDVEDFITGYKVCDSCGDHYYLEEEDKNECILSIYKDLEEVKSRLSVLESNIKKQAVVDQHKEGQTTPVLIGRLYKNTYDDNGNITSVTYYDSEGNVECSDKYTYDDNGNETSSTYYDSEGNKTSSERYDSEGNVDYSCKYTYDDNGN